MDLFSYRPVRGISANHRRRSLPNRKSCVQRLHLLCSTTSLQVVLGWVMEKNLGGGAVFKCGQAAPPLPPTHSWHSSPGLGGTQAWICWAISLTPLPSLHHRNRHHLLGCRPGTRRGGGLRGWRLAVMLALRLPSPRPPTCAGLWPDGPQCLHLQQLRLAPTLDSGPGRGLGRFPTHRALLLQLFSLF